MQICELFDSSNSGTMEVFLLCERRQDFFLWHSIICIRKHPKYSFCLFQIFRITDEDNSLKQMNEIIYLKDNLTIETTCCYI